MISIVIPLWNKAPYVGRCLDSVAAQTYRDFEAVVVDDGSTDDGPERVAAYADGRIRLVRQPNGGVAVARNRGVSEARGEWVAFLDADDEWAPDHLATLVDLMARYPHCGMVSASYWLHHDATGRRCAALAFHVGLSGETGFPEMNVRVNHTRQQIAALCFHHLIGRNAGRGVLAFYDFNNAVVLRYERPYETAAFIYQGRIMNANSFVHGGL